MYCLFWPAESPERVKGKDIDSCHSAHQYLNTIIYYPVSEVIDIFCDNLISVVTCDS